jgi:two-component system phosphate regulon sensor histidine kinase PhoR
VRKRIFASICAVALGSVLLLVLCVTALEYRDTNQDAWASLRADAAYIAAGVNAGGEAYLQETRGYPRRVTLMAPDGEVLFDDRQEADAMENHAARPEVTEALRTGTGQSERISPTLRERTLYYAVKLENGGILRVSMTADSIWAEVLRFVPWLAFCAVLIILAAAFAAWRQTDTLIASLGKINLDAPLANDNYEELSPFLRRIAAQKDEIERRMRELEEQRQEFAAIVGNMAEGLLVVSAEGLVVTINQSARDILGISEDFKGAQPLPALNRSLELENAVKSALGGKRAGELTLQGRRYRLAANSIPLAGKEGSRGVVLLLLDDTERLEVEERRREFAANVSHELKTPLTAISGIAEILYNGLVRPEDITGFAGRIQSETTRLIALVEDIIKLSRLDEKDTNFAFETVELFALARQTAAAFEEPAAGKGIRLTVEGDPLCIPGVRSILNEVFYNLLDNAIRYSDAGGEVKINISVQGGRACVSVTDTGIGIPPEYQDRIFERFYRVDKNHSPQSGGTGLGLAIVKRGVLFHGGTVALQSAPGKGSVFTVFLPLEPSLRSE